MNADDMEVAAADFIEVARLARMPISRDQIKLTTYPAPHTRPKFTYGRKFVYVYSLCGHCLKVGEVTGTKPSSRLTRHYDPGGSAALAKRILKEKRVLRDLVPSEMQAEIAGLSESNVGPWMTKSLELTLVEFDKKTHPFIVSLMESFLQCRLRPSFEGKPSTHGSVDVDALIAALKKRIPPEP